MFTPAKRLVIMNENIVKNGLILWLNGIDFLNNPPSATWIDRSGNNNHATPTNFEYTTSSGSDGQGGVAFDGANDVLTLPVSVNDFTFQLKFKVTGDGNYPRLYSANRDAQYLYRNPIDGIFNNTGDGDIGTYSLAINTEIVLSVKRVGNLLTAYVDGAQIGSNTESTTQFVDIKIGNRSAADRGLIGNIKTILLYSRGLSDSEIMQNYIASK